jgi:hypothetical protein
MLRDRSMSASGKLHRSVGIGGQWQQWAVISSAISTVSRKQTLAAPQKIGKMGSFQTFSASRHHGRSAQSSSTRTALTGHSPIDRLAAVRPVRPAIRCNREIKRVANSHTADKPVLAAAAIADAAFPRSCSRFFCRNALHFTEAAIELLDLVSSPNNSFVARG